MISKTLLAATLALAGTLAAGAAQAHSRDDVQWSVTIGTPVYAAPVYSAPAPVLVQPAPIRFDGYRQPSRWDADGDGIPNRYDAVYNPRWDRNGDGVPDRYEHERRYRDHRDYRDYRDYRDHDTWRDGDRWHR